MAKDPGQKSGRLQRIGQFFARDLWKVNLSTLSRLPRSALQTARLGTFVVEGFVRDRCLLRAAALTFTTVLSIVPLLAIAFSVLGGIQALQEYEQPAIDYVIDTFVPKEILEEDADDSARNKIADQIRLQLRQASESIRRGKRAVNAVGIVFVALTAISLLTAVERSLNSIWGVRRGRALWKRLGSYWAIITIVPVLLAGSFAVTGSLQFGTVVNYLRRIPILGQAVFYLAGIVLTWSAFVFLYAFMPNTKVKLRAALAGGVAAGLLFELTKWLNFIITIRLASYRSLYGTLAAFPVFLFLLYVMWLIFLFGAEVAYASQNIKTYARERRHPTLNQRSKESLALSLLVAVGRRFHEAQPPWTADELADHFDVSTRFLEDVGQALVEAGMLRRLGDRAAVFEPAGPLDRFHVHHVLQALRAWGSDDLLTAPRDERRVVEEVLGQSEVASADALRDLTLQDLVTRLKPPEPSQD